MALVNRISHLRSQAMGGALGTNRFSKVVSHSNSPRPLQFPLAKLNMLPQTRQVVSSPSIQTPRPSMPGRDGGLKLPNWGPNPIVSPALRTSTATASAGRVGQPTQSIAGVDGRLRQAISQEIEKSAGDATRPGSGNAPAQASTQPVRFEPQLEGYGRGSVQQGSLRKEASAAPGGRAGGGRERGGSRNSRTVRTGVVQGHYQWAEVPVVIPSFP